MARTRGKSTVKHTPIGKNLINYGATTISTGLINPDDSQGSTGNNNNLLPFVKPTPVQTSKVVKPDDKVESVWDSDATPGGVTNDKRTEDRALTRAKGVVDASHASGYSMADTVRELVHLGLTIEKNITQYIADVFKLAPGAVDSVVGAIEGGFFKDVTNANADKGGGGSKFEEPKPSAPKDVPETKEKPKREDETLNPPSQQSNTPGDPVWAINLSKSGSQTSFKDAENTVWISMQPFNNGIEPYLFKSYPRTDKLADYYDLGTFDAANKVIDTRIRRWVSGPELAEIKLPSWMQNVVGGASRILPMCALLQYLNGETNTEIQKVVGAKLRAANNYEYRRGTELDEAIWDFFQGGLYANHTQHWVDTIGQYIMTGMLG